MKTDRDGEIEGQGRKRKPPRRGGKSLQRLFLFNGQRDPILNEAVVARARPPKVARARWMVTNTGRRLTAGDAPSASVHARAAELAGDLIGAAAALPQVTAAAAPGATSPVWRPLGPDRIPDGQTYGTNRIDVVGRVAAIAVDPANARHVLCGAAGGGVWESFDEGATWAARTDRMPTLAIGALAFDPTNPSVVYAGSGEGNFYARLGVGVFRSADGGATWVALAPGPLLGAGFYEIVVDPANPATLLAATTAGFFVSMDSGATWINRRPTTCWSISLHSAGGPAAEILATFSNGVFRSTDRGATFTAVALPQAPTTPWNRLAVTRIHSQPDIAYVFGAAGANPFLWRRVGANWTRVALPTRPNGKSLLDTGQAWYDWYVAAPADRVDRVYLGAIEGLRGDLSANGWTWQNYITQGANSIHPDQHCLTFSPGNSQVLYAGNDGGIYRSADGGASWRSCNAGLAITEVEYMAADPNDSGWLLAGTQDNGTIRLNAQGWRHVADGDGGDCGVNASNADEAYHSYFNVSLERSDQKADAGSWTSLQPTAMASLFYPPISVAVRTVAIGGEFAIVTRNGAAPWTQVLLGIGPGDVCTASCAPSPDRIYIGSQQGRLLRLDWNGTGWAKTMLTSAFAGYVSCIATDPSNPARLWATSSQAQPGGARVARSDDGGATWMDCTAGLPPIAKNAIVVDPATANRAWVAADVGVYETNDAGATWTPKSDGLPNAIAADLIFHAAGRRLICGTRNRGVWSLDGL